MVFNFYIPTRILFGKGAVKKLHRQRLPGKKALIVISNGKSTRTNGYLDKVEEELKQAGVETFVYDKVSPNPSIENVMEGAKMARELGCDMVVGLGGGSPIDAAKSIAIMAANDGDLWDYVHGGTGKGMKMKNQPLPIVAIPTTAGTGTEADPWTVVTNEATSEKISGGNDRTFPVLAIVDTDFMMTVPPKFTAYQGFDALFHSTEGYIASIANLMSDMYALKAIESVGRNLAAACTDGNNAEAREKVAFGSTLSGVVMCVSCTTSEHALEHALSAFHHDLPHGAGLIMISLAYYTHFVKNCPALHNRFVEMAKVMGRTNAADPMEFVEALADLQKACGVDNLKMSDYGITPDEFPAFAKNAMETMAGLFALDQLKLTEEDCIQIYQNSYH